MSPARAGRRGSAEINVSRRCCLQAIRFIGLRVDWHSRSISTLATNERPTVPTSTHCGHWCGVPKLLVCVISSP